MDKKLKQLVWQKCVKYLQNTIPIQNFLEYINPLQIHIKKNKLIILTPNDYVKDKIEKNYLSIIKNVIYNISDEINDIEIITGSILTSINHHKKENDKNNISKICINMHINELLYKKINNFAKAAILSTIKSPGKLYNPIFIYGEENKCRFHIAKNIFNNLKLLHKKLNIQFFNITTISKQIDQFYNKIDILILYEIHCLKDNALLQNNLTNIITTLINKKKQIIILSDVNPIKLKNINTKLILLLSSGLIIKLNNYNIKTEKKPLKNSNSNKNISITDIIKNVLIYYNLNSDVLKLRRRTKSLVKIRHIIFYLCKELTVNSLSEISNALGSYTHATVLYSYKKIKTLIKKENPIINEINDIKILILS